MKENRMEWKGTWIGRVPRILDDGARLPPLLLVDDPLVLLQLVVAHAVEGVLRVRRLEHRRVVLEVPLDDPLARRTNLKEIIQNDKMLGKSRWKFFCEASGGLLFKHFPSPSLSAVQKIKLIKKNEKCGKMDATKSNFTFIPPYPSTWLVWASCMFFTSSQLSPSRT